MYSRCPSILIFLLVLLVASCAARSPIATSASCGPSAEASGRCEGVALAKDEAEVFAEVNDSDSDAGNADVRLLQSLVRHPAVHRKRDADGGAKRQQTRVRFPPIDWLKKRAVLLEELHGLEQQKQDRDSRAPCVDNNAYCPRWAHAGECQRNPEWMHDNCKRSCKVCQQHPAPPRPQPTPAPTAPPTSAPTNAPTKAPAPAPVPAPAPKPPAPDGDCKDDHANCLAWATHGECEKNSQWMHENCKQSCQLCAGEETCADSLGDCPAWADAGECQRNEVWMKVNCRRSCHACNCDTVSDCDIVQCDAQRLECYNAVDWAMTSGIRTNPEWYPGLTEDSHFEDFQQFLHDTHPGQGCPVPCPWSPPTTTTSTTTTTTPPPGTPACPPRSKIPDPPAGPTDYNGISWPSLCFVGWQEEHVLLIGDWGGVYGTGIPPKPADNTGTKRDFIKGLDDQAQTLVANEFNKRAALTRPRYVLNVGDNFYWSGIFENCGKSVQDSIMDFIDRRSHAHKQVKAVFEDVYKGPGVDGIPWISCLGNHDYGGYQFNHAWDQQIVYTWGPSGRWIMPAQYYHLHVDYPTKDFSVDYYVLDSNNQDAADPSVDPLHNICSAENNVGANCAPFGPSDPYDCLNWFIALWEKQLVWLEDLLKKSTADWQIVVTHFPPEVWTHYGKNVEDWKRLGNLYGIDLIVAGHRHSQELYAYNSWNVVHMAGIPYVVTGGGGGITSEETPSNTNDAPEGNHQYGFMDMTITKREIKIEGFNQLGQMTKNITVRPKKIYPPNFDPPAPADTTNGGYPEPFSGGNGDSMP